MNVGNLDKPPTPQISQAVAETLPEYETYHRVLLSSAFIQNLLYELLIISLSVLTPLMTQ